MIVEITNKQQKTTTFFSFEDVLWIQHNATNNYTTIYMRQSGNYIQIPPNSKAKMGEFSKEDQESKEVTVDSLPRLWSQYMRNSSPTLLRGI